MNRPGKITKRPTLRAAIQWLADNEDLGEDGATVSCCLVADLWGVDQDWVAGQARSTFAAQHPDPQHLQVVMHDGEARA